MAPWFWEDLRLLSVYFWDFCGRRANVVWRVLYWRSWQALVAGMGVGGDGGWLWGGVSPVGRSRPVAVWLTLALGSPWTGWPIKPAIWGRADNSAHSLVCQWIRGRKTSRSHESNRSCSRSYSYIGIFKSGPQRWLGFTVLELIVGLLFLVLYTFGWSWWDLGKLRFFLYKWSSFLFFLAIYHSFPSISLVPMWPVKKVVQVSPPVGKKDNGI